MPQGSPTQPSSTHRSNTSLCMKQTSCTCESCKHETLHQTLSDTPLLPSPPVFWDDILPGICVYHHYSRPFLNKPSVRALFSFPWCEQISSQGPCTTDNGPMLHLASGITTHLASIRYRSRLALGWTEFTSPVCTLGSDVSPLKWLSLIFPLFMAIAVLKTAVVSKECLLSVCRF